MRNLAEIEIILDEFIAATAKPSVKITAHPSNETTLWQSKFGGEPYFPKDGTYPTSPSGNPLTLLAQINFAEVPVTEDFPKQGILQFYIDASENATYGLIDDLQIEQSTFRIIYFPEPDLNIENLINNFTFLPQPIVYPIKVEDSFALSFEVTLDPPTPSDFQFNTLVESYFSALEKIENNQEKSELIEAILDELEENEKYRQQLNKHTLGGYPYLVQDDYRGEHHNRFKDYTFLLFQMVSEPDHSIKWGDMGAGYFFIEPSALKRLDFSQVLYTYACS
ncbi:hypothetical protein NIES2119_12050 [[Phormidium ambiguum] IAM M-71]|uniref:DUF1963 domain-containing protein n=1 Tax=[Phormidium ambiguum] IAM M-71 TaxID=454136 RepID=A0A1U7IL27_9CYAN|nr:YwqG family protein [Phormidium ambiguum]OKH37875.1 hypothetical protein NIES2119_12050 [Phormidium ambiguum IAM M-71]